MRVIIIENDEAFRKVVSECLRRDGIEVIAQACDVPEALELLERQHPDVILTDHDMPGLTGIEFVQHLRDCGDQTPVVMLSGESDPDAIANALAAGVNRFLTKPVTLSVLTAALRQTSAAAA
jgi:CheY-like chemotaxis protein